MTIQNKNINCSSDKNPEKGIKMDFNDNLLLNLEDSAHFDKFGDYMKGRLDLYDVMNDQSLPEVDKMVREMISDYSEKDIKNKADESFVRDSFIDGEKDKTIINEINQIKIEIGKNNLNELSEEWVKDWHEKKQRNLKIDPKTEEIRNFITSSLESENHESETILNQKENAKPGRSRIIRYLSLSAAAVLGAIFLVRTLLPSSDPGKIYNNYYKPFNVISSVTRGSSTNINDSYSVAINKYKTGDYQTAALGFSDAILNDSSLIAPRFFMGLTQLELGNTNKAIVLLTRVAHSSGEYRKEAEWYLGLTYLKAKDIIKASEYFKILAQSPGYYSERSEKILRRLK